MARRFLIPWGGAAGWGTHGLSGHRPSARGPPQGMTTVAMTTVARARFSQLVLPRLDEGYRLAHWLTGNATDAEDVMQEACCAPTGGSRVSRRETLGHGS